MKTVITINVVEWVLYLVVIWLALSLADSTLAIYKRYLEWRIKKIKKPKQMSETKVNPIIKRVKEYSPELIELPEFDLTKKSDHIYCIEWGMKKAKLQEFKVFQKMLRELKEIN